MLGYYLLLMLIMSLLTSIIYKVDKIKAIKGKYRIKEKTLLLFSLMFGSLGGLIGLYVFRHKNKHFKFIFLNYLFLIIHIIIAIFIYKYC